MTPFTYWCLPLFLLYGLLVAGFAVKYILTYINGSSVKV